METQKQPVTLGPVQQTLLLTLLARANETRKERPMLKDPKAVEIIEQLDYDFTKYINSSGSAQSLAGAVARTLIMDMDVKEFLAKYPEGTVVEIGCGLNTRFERLDNGNVKWFDLDLPDSLALRKKFFTDNNPRRKMIEASVLDTHWFEFVKATGGPWCFISEAVIIYLEEEQAKQALAQIGKAFPTAWLVMDTTSQSVVDAQDRHALMRHMDKESWFRWACDDPKQVEEWLGLKLIRSKTFMDLPPEYFDSASFPWGFLNSDPNPSEPPSRKPPGLGNIKSRGYYFNTYRGDQE